MTLETLQNEIIEWPQSDLQRLQGFLVALRHRREGTATRMAAKLDDTNPERWVTLAEAEERLGLDNEDS